MNCACQAATVAHCSCEMYCCRASMILARSCYKQVLVGDCGKHAKKGNGHTNKLSQHPPAAAAHRCCELCCFLICHGNAQAGQVTLQHHQLHLPAQHGRARHTALHDTARQAWCSRYRLHGQHTVSHFMAMTGMLDQTSMRCIAGRLTSGLRVSACRHLLKGTEAEIEKSMIQGQQP